MLAAPLAAWLVTRLPAAVLGAAVGGLIVLTNLGTVLGGAGVAGVAVPIVHLSVAAAWVGLVAVAVRRVLAVRRAVPTEPLVPA
jgi:hypothetical protein